MSKPVEEPVIEDWLVPSDIPLSDQAFCIDFSPTQDVIVGGAINGSILLYVFILIDFFFLTSSGLAMELNKIQQFSKLTICIVKLVVLLSLPPMDQV